MHKNFISDTPDPFGMSESEPRSFACKKCGHPFMARPPYDGYNTALAKPCSIKDHDAAQLYECEKCDNRNVLYWCRRR